MNPSDVNLIRNILGDPIAMVGSQMSIMCPDVLDRFEEWKKGFDTVSIGAAYNYLAKEIGCEVMPDDIAPGTDAAPFYRELYKAMVCLWLGIPYTKGGPSIITH